ncbi:MAG: methyltransferase domain-containing protein [Planctomycetota bacterium]|jgi:SAM-dependent methyltransferase
MPNDASYWRGRWADGETGWDLGGPCPVFEELLGSQRRPLPGRVAFPGCGGAHDVALFREHGYDAIGFDFVRRRDDVPIETLDVFEIGARYAGEFDAIVEYTCYCAIDPSRRPEYAASMHAALKPGGTLVALMFPMDKPVDEGPPYGIEEHEIVGVLGAGLELLYLETPASSVKPRLGRERLALFRK